MYVLYMNKCMENVCKAHSHKYALFNQDSLITETENDYLKIK